MNKETKTVEVQEYLKSIWRKPSEKPSNKGYGDNVIPVMLIDSENNVSSFQFVSDDMDWNEVVEDEDVVFWSYVTDIRPNIPNLKDYKTIKTYEDACTALGEKVDEETLKKAGVPKHIIAQMKLELICKALWGDEVKVYPAPDGNCIYWYPRFDLYNQSEIDGMSEKERGCLLSVHADFRSSRSSAHSGFRLCLDTEGKAIYFGKQFLELWAEAIAFNFSVGERLK